MTQPIKLLLLIPHLGGGGAEQVTAQLAQRLDPGRFEIHLGVLVADRAGAQPLPAWVAVHRLGVARVRHGWLRLLLLIRRLRPRVVLSSMAHLNFLVLLLKPILPREMRVLARQNTTASAIAQSSIERLAYRWLYPRADLVLCQTMAMMSDLAGGFGIPAAKLATVPNPVDVERIRASVRTADGCRWPTGAWPRLLAVGRLSHEKGFDLLVRTLPGLRKSYPKLRLTLLGAGQEEAMLRKLSHELQVSEAVELPGHVADPAAWFAGATLWVLPSRLEGMPNALLEAAAAGLPIAATPCCRGVVELLKGAPGVWLASEVSVESLFEAVACALAAVAARPDSPQRFEHRFLAPFEANAAIAAYQELLERVAGQGPA